MSKLNDPKEKMTSANPFADLAGDMTEMQREAAEWMATAMPRFMGMSNLAAHPMGAMAAASAIGAGMAGQMYGMMAGAMAGAVKAANMLASETTGRRSELFGAANPFNFDWATGTFDDTKAEDPVTHQPPVTPEAPAKAPAGPKRPAAKPAPGKTGTPEPVALADEPEAPAAASSIEPVMPEDFVKPKAHPKPDAPDDLKAISGIGPKLEAVLNSLGIWTYEQIAGLTPHEVAWLDDYLQFKGRIERDGWVAQAAELAGKA
ncbi:MAG: hypothetical protein Kow0026_25120 [Oricola sp.]